MRKLSFLALSVIVMLFLSGCTKEDNLQNSNPVNPVENNPQEDPYSVSYSNWTTNASLSWSEGSTTEPSRESDIIAPELTQQMIDAGSFLLIYAKSTVDGSVQSMPAEYSDLDNVTNTYSASYSAGSIFLSHTTSFNGVFEVPDDSNEISFRYIIITPNTPAPNGRPVTIDDFRDMSYEDVADLLSIPE